MGNLQVARDGARDGLSRALRYGLAPWVLVGIFTYAELAHAAGDDDRALALLGMAQHHPSFSRDNKRMIDNTLAEWKLDAAAVAKGLPQGAELNFDKTVMGLVG